MHAGSGAALALVLREELAQAGARGVLALVLTLAPAAVAGLSLERPIEQRLGGPRSVAWAQIVAGTALALADRRPERRPTAELADHLAVGAAQVAALAPGVSRMGAALTVARARCLDRRASTRLAWLAALPVSAGAALLKGTRLARGELRTDLHGPLAAGAAAAFASTLAAAPAGRRLTSRAVLPVAAYRVALGLVALLRR